MKNANIELHQTLQAKGIRYWKLADELGITPQKLSVKLRYELNPQERIKFDRAIEKLSKQGGKNGHA